MRLTAIWPGLVAAMAMTLVVACGGSGSATGSASSSQDVGRGSLTGAGATFPEPFYTKAFYQYSQDHSRVTVNYQAIGSGAGIQQFTKGTVDFGASDVPMNAGELQAAGGDSSLIEIATTIGVVSIAYNLPQVDRLQLDGDTLARIFLGEIKKWDDAAIKSLNRGVSLPAKDITVVHRSDGSGTTYAFTDYLSKQSPAWKSRVGTAKAVSWPVGVGGKGNEGVANAVQQNDGAIGYVELAYVIQAKMKQAYLKNHSGKYVQGSLDGASAAAAQARNVSPANFSITDQSGDQSYPISTFSWVFLRKDMADAQKGKALVYLFRWLVSDGQSVGKSLQYAPLPKDVQDYSMQQLKTVTSGGAPILR